MSSAVISYRKALKQGINPALYLYETGFVPLGRISAMLDAKIWGCMIMGIGCYFTRVKDGAKFLLTVYYDTERKGYRLPNREIDILTCPVDRVYDLHVGENGRGNPVMVDLVGPTDDWRRGEISQES
jgi:hypothetical protein